MTIKKCLLTLCCCTLLCTSSACANAQNEGIAEDNDVQASTESSTDDNIPVESITESDNTLSSSVITENVENKVKKFVFDEFELDCSISYAPSDYKILTNDYRNPDWLWNNIKKYDPVYPTTTVSEYAAYWEICGIPQDSIVIWEMANDKFAVSEQSDGSVQYWDYTANNQYLFTGRSDSSACYCYCMAEFNDDFRLPYVNIVRAWILEGSELSLVIQN